MPLSKQLNKQTKRVREDSICPLRQNKIRECIYGCISSLPIISAQKGDKSNRLLPFPIKADAYSWSNSPQKSAESDRGQVLQVSAHKCSTESSVTIGEVLHVVWSRK